jgi:hypothetical protein
VGPPTTATDVLPNGGHHEALPDKLLLHLHRTAERAEVDPAGPTASFMRWLGATLLADCMDSVDMVEHVVGLHRQDKPH